jgi:hypothetical protein
LQELAEIYAKLDQETSGFVTNDTEKELQEQGISTLSVPIDVNEISEACELIDEHFEYTGGSKTFILLGDLFAGYGACDHVMLALLNEIKAQAEQAGGECVILASDHGTFLKLLENYYNGTRSAHVSAKLDPNYIRKLGEFLVENTQLFYFDERTNTFFTHYPITRKDLEEFVNQANKVIADVIADPTKYELDPSQFNFGPLEIPQNDDPKEISQFVKRANQYYKAVMSWFFKDLSQSPDFEESNNKRYLVVPVESFFNYLSQSPDFEEFNKKRYLPPVESLTAVVVGTGIRFRHNNSSLVKPFNVTMVHGHEEGKYNEVRDVYNLNNKAGKLPAYRDVGYSIYKKIVLFKDLYIYTNSAKSAKIHQN